MATDSKRFDLCTPREGRDGKTRWHKVGVAFEGERGITAYFDSLPLLDAKGKCVVMFFEAREREEGGTQPAASKPKMQSAGKGGMDDEIPF
jgi:hypothetical protein